MNAATDLPVRFRYRAARPDGHVVRGTVRAADAREAKRSVEQQGLLLLSLRAHHDIFRFAHVPRRDVAAAFRNVSTLVASGVPLERALVATEGLVGTKLASVLAEVRASVKEGRTVSESLAMHPAVFPASAIGVIRAGERGSRLADACRAVAEQLEEDTTLRSQVHAALAYPLLILVVGLFTVAIMGSVVVPRFASVLADLGAELPPSTRLLLAASSLLERYGLVAVLLAGAGAPLFLRWVGSRTVRARVDRWLLVVPVVGPLRLAFATARTCRALGGALSNGMPLLDALDAATEAAGDHEVARRILATRADVSRGAPLTASLRQHRALASHALQVVGIGESTGQLGAMTRRAGDIAAEHAQRGLRTAVALVEPLLVIGLGILVALVAASLLRAVYSIRPI